MPLIDYFTRSGNWLFRKRSFMPLLLVVFIALAMRRFTYFMHTESADRIWEAVCLLVSFFGLAIRIWTVGCVPARTSGRNTKSQVADALNTTGIYSLLRHPLYLGNYFMMLGVVLFAHHFWLVLVYTLLFVIYYERIMLAEEDFLMQRYGEQYLRWAHQTPAIIPRFSHYCPPALKFSLRNVLRREYNGFFAVIISMFTLEVAGDLIVNQRVELDSHWMVLIGLSLSAWIGLRMIRKRTRWLVVEGR